MNDHKKVSIPNSLKTKYRAYKFLFLCIKRLDLLESAKFSGKITQAYHEKTQEAFLKEYEQFSEAIPNFNFNDFVKVKIKRNFN